MVDREVAQRVRARGRGEHREQDGEEEERASHRSASRACFACQRPRAEPVVEREPQEPAVRSPHARSSPRGRRTADRRTRAAERAAPSAAPRRRAAARQRPAERVGGADARGVRPRAPRERQPARAVPWSLSNTASSTSVLTPARASSRCCDAHEREVLARGARPPGRQLRLAERDDVLGQRQPRDERAVAADGGRPTCPRARPAALARPRAGAYLGRVASARAYAARASPGRARTSARSPRSTSMAAAFSGAGPPAAEARARAEAAPRRSPCSSRRYDTRA